MDGDTYICFTPSKVLILNLMQMKNLPSVLLTIAGFLTSLTAAAQMPMPQLSQVSKTIDSLAAIDQRLGKVKSGIRAHRANQRLMSKRSSLAARHQPLLQALVEEHGYLGFQQIGKQSADNFAVLVQRAAAYPSFQQKVLELMWPEVKRKNARTRYYNALSHYLTQGTSALDAYVAQVADLGYGRPLNEPIRPPQYVGKRRPAIGIETKDYYWEWVNSTKLELAPIPLGSHD